MRVHFASRTSALADEAQSSERAVNCYTEKAPETAKTPLTLIGTPGLKLFGTIGDGPIRASHSMGGVWFVVSGADLYSVDPAGTGTLIGSLSAGSNDYQMANNLADPQQLFIRAGNFGWIYDGTTLAQITDADFPGATWVTYADTYFLYGDPTGNGRWGLSASLDGTSYDALDFATAEASSDVLVAGVVDHRDLWLMGEKTIEVWWDSGNADFPYERSPQAFMERGCKAKKSVAQDDNTVFWLGDDLIVYQALAYVPTRISTHAVETAIAGYSNTSTAEAFFYTQNGHKFYVLTFAEGTWVFDAATGLWHERQSFGLPRWRASTYINIYDKHLVGDFQNGKVYELDPDTYDEDGVTIQRRIISPVLSVEARRTTMPHLYLDFATGVGLTTGQGSDPQVMLRWSDDGGDTWSNEHWRSLGKTGAKKTRVHWNRLGQFGDKGRIFELTKSDPVEFSLLGAHADLNPGNF